MLDSREVSYMDLSLVQALICGIHGRLDALEAKKKKPKQVLKVDVTFMKSQDGGRLRGFRLAAEPHEDQGISFEVELTCPKTTMPIMRAQVYAAHMYEWVTGPDMSIALSPGAPVTLAVIAKPKGWKIELSQTECRAGL